MSGLRRLRIPVLPMLLVLLACERDVADSTSGPGGLAMSVEVAAGLTAGRIEEGRVTIEGPSPRGPITMTPGTSRTIDGLTPGQYTVVFEGLSAGDVELYGERSGVAVTGGSNTPVTVTLTSFVPELATLPAIVDGGTDVVVEFSAVAGATAYTVEWANNPNFVNLQSAQTTTTSLTVRLTAEGQYHFRVRARNRLGSNGRASDPGSTEVPATAVPTDQEYITTGARHSCALDRTGMAYCWGGNGSGQLGIGVDDDASESSSPVSVMGGNTFVTISAGPTGNHTCALDRAGRASCWGRGFDGEIGDGGTVDQTVPTPVSGGHVFISISAGNGHTCAVTVQGNAYCWGRNTQGAIGMGATTPSQPLPTAVQTNLTFLSISAGTDFTCAVATTREVWCWGSNANAQMGDGGPPAGAPLRQLLPVRINGIPPVDGIDAGAFHACAWIASGAAWCWGRGSLGRLGDGDASPTFRPPRQVLNVTDFTRISIGNGFTCGVTSGHQAYCWGFGLEGRLGTGDDRDRSTPAVVTGIAGVADIAGGGNHSCAVTLAGEAYCWGSWDNGELGNGKVSIQPRAQPVGAPLPTQITHVAGGFQHGCAMRALDGLAWCWGLNQRGQLGTGDTANQHSPRALGPRFQSLSAGTGTFMCGVATGAAAMCWGDNAFGQLGNGSTAAALVPAMVAAPQVVAHVSAGGEHACAVLNNPAGQVRCWGRNQYGQLGDSTTSNRTAPTVAQGLPAMAAVSAGGAFTCGLAVDGRAFCWGRNRVGALGDGTLLDRPVPVQVQGMPALAAVSAGFEHACAIDNTGAAWCWGGGAAGELGHGAEPLASTTPVPVAGGIVFNSIRAGVNITCGIATDGRGYCWGANNTGRLGNDDVNLLIANAPVEIAGGLRFFVGSSPGFAATASVIQPAANHTCAVALTQRAYCWGARDFGALGEGVFPFDARPVRVDGTVVFRAQ